MTPTYARINNANCVLVFEWIHLLFKLQGFYRDTGNMMISC